MYHIKTLNNIAPKGLAELPAQQFTVNSGAESCTQGILVRSASMHETPLPEGLLAVARAGAGVNNIPVPACSEQGIVVFNTPGANANAVMDLGLASRDGAGGIAWAKTLAGEADAAKQVEKGKSRFAGPELLGKTLGVVGLGAIGVRVANLAVHLGMNVLGYDPYLSIDAAWSLSRHVHHCTSLSQLYSQSDYITLHLPATKETIGMLNAAAFAQMKHGVRILNFARAELSSAPALAQALESGHCARYVTDFPTPETLALPGCVCIPHLGASTPESEENCAVMAARQLRDYLLDGNIANSVNFPAVSMPRAGAARVCVIHRNVPGILAGITQAATAAKLNIENMANKSKGEWAYTMLDLSGPADEQMARGIARLPDVVRVRVV